jgi:SAM-dependent methyltransferase
MRYQFDYSRHFPATKDRARRARKALKIIRILEDFLGRGLSDLTCLDMGCSLGVITDHLARSARFAVGMDIDSGAIREAGASSANASFIVADVGNAPFADGMFDVIVCSQVYEHVPDLGLLIAEIYRLLRDDGVCFFSGPNRWAVIERHYGLPLLSWLPPRWAGWYVRVTGRAQEYYERPRSMTELRRALSQFAIHDYTPRLLSDPTRFALDEEIGVFRYVIAAIPTWCWRSLRRWVPNFNWILTKDAQKT